MMHHQQQQQQQQSQQPCSSSSSSTSLTPSRTIITSFTPRKLPVGATPAADTSNNNGARMLEEEEGDWVLCLTAENNENSSSSSSSSSRTLACALSNGLVQVYDQERLHLMSSHAMVAQQQHQQMPMHHNHSNTNNIIHDLVYGPQNNVLVVAGHDGGITVLDLRVGSGAGTTSTTTSTNNNNQFRSFSSTSSNISNSSSTTSMNSIGGGSGATTTATGSNSIVARAQLPLGQAALSVSLGYDGYLCAVGSNKARVHFFDLRSPHQLLGSYVDAHTDEVTQVKFQPRHGSSNNSNTLLTASEDGLVCLFDTTQPTEESALKAVLNVGAPSRKIGFCGKDLNTIYCLTGSETLSFWNADSATCALNFGSTTRQVLSQALLVDDNEMSMDYLVDAHWDAASQELLLLAGTVGSSSPSTSTGTTTNSSSSSSIGDTALFRLAANNNDDHRRRRDYLQQHQQQQNFEGRHHYIGDYVGHASQQQQQQQQQFEVCHVLRGGHRGVVRGWCSLSQSVMVTAGEDARLCEWNRRLAQPQQQQHQSTFLSAPPQTLPHHQLAAAGHEQVSMFHHHHHHSGEDANHKRSASHVGSPFRRQRRRPS